MSLEFSLPTLTYGIEILLISYVHELRVDCYRVRSLILNLLAAEGRRALQKTTLRLVDSGSRSRR
jgi:hypothetical protein